MSTAPERAGRAGVLTAVVALLVGLLAGAAHAAEPPEITAAGAVLWVPDEDLVLHGVAEDVGRPMASTTKIMTLLLALEAGAEDDAVTVSPTAAALGQATLDLRAGQVLPMRSLVAGLLLRSGNDAAVAVAEHVAGSEAAFVELMNARAAELGLTQTGFVNASGLTNDPAHRASPLDLARMGALAMAYPVFAEFAAAPRATVPGLAPMVSRNELLGRYPGATGIKTGFTSLAGNTLVASATRGDRSLYAVVLGSEDSFADAAALLDHGFEDHRRVAPVAEGVPLTRYRWAGEEVGLVAAAPLVATVPAGSPVIWRTELPPLLERPVRQGQVVGAARLLSDGTVLREVDLIAAEDVPGAAPDGPAGARVGAALQEALRAFALVADIDRASGIAD